MSYYVVFKDRNRQPVKVTDDQAMLIAEAKDEGKQIRTKNGFTDTALISDIVPEETFSNRYQTKVENKTPDYSPDERSSYNLALIELMKASRARKVEIPDWVKPQHRQFVKT